MENYHLTRLGQVMASFCIERGAAASVPKTAPIWSAANLTVQGWGGGDEAAQSMELGETAQPFDIVVILQYISSVVLYLSYPRPFRRGGAGLSFGP